jgi:2-(1,2-epoxy-1,2-dihydrophenyl)acetyl-CoA isomerase
VASESSAREPVRLERDGYVATVTIDRPGTRNACSMEMWLTLGEHFRALAATHARVVVLTGANGDFCSGADVVRSEGSSGWEGNQLTALRLLADSMLAIRDCPIPVIAKVDGYAVGAGFSLALAADLLWCSDRAKFSAIFVKRGLSLDYGSSWTLVHRVGLHKAKELALTGDTIDAARAERIGFVNAVVAADELDAAVAEVAGKLAAGPPIAMSVTKRMLDNAATASLTQALETEALAGLVNLGTSDMREALMAFREKRPPTFEGR